MTGWARWGGILAAVGLAAALSGCGQLFTEAVQPETLTQLSSRVDSLGAQVGELQAAMAGSGGLAATGTAAAGTAAASSSVPAGLPSAVVEADVLNVRDDASLTGTVRGTLLQNAEVGILQEDGNWTEITYTNARTQVTLTGWVDSDYLGPTIPPASGTTVASGAGSPAAASQPASASATSMTAAGSVPSMTSGY